MNVISSQNPGDLRQTVVPPLVLLVFLFLGTATGLGDVRQGFVQVAYIGQGIATGGHLAGYDTDHDGLEELLLCGHGTVWLYEHVGSNQYVLVHRLPQRGSWAAGDIDIDGLSDIVVQSHDSLEVFESPAPDSYPTHCVWRCEEPFGGGAAPTWITDLDQDGRREMLFTKSGKFIYIFENIANNKYTRVWRDSLWTPYGSIWETCNGDFDLDEKIEFVTSDSDGNVIVFENTAVGVDSFAITWTGSVPAFNVYNDAAANDMDRDGKPEFVVGGDHNFGGARKCVFTVFETTGYDTYEAVWADSSIISGFLDFPSLTCGDVDADSIDEMIFAADELGVFLYKCTGSDTYERIWEWYTPFDMGCLLVYDLNRNGYGELIVSTEGGTWIFEKELPGIEEANDQLPMANVQLMQNVPNPFTHNTTIAYHLPDAGCQMRDARYTTLRVYDVSGRLVKTLVDESKQPGTHAAMWDGRGEGGEEVPSGVYFYRLQAGDYAGTRRMVLLR